MFKALIWLKPLYISVKYPLFVFSLASCSPVRNKPHFNSDQVIWWTDVLHNFSVTFYLQAVQMLVTLHHHLLSWYHCIQMSLMATAVAAKTDRSSVEENQLEQNGRRRFCQKNLGRLELQLQQAVLPVAVVVPAVHHPANCLGFCRSRTSQHPHHLRLVWVIMKWDRSHWFNR